jgi:hypothetical protein
MNRLMDTRSETEINGGIVARIRTMVGYGATVEDVVRAIGESGSITTRWVRFVATQCVRGAL